MARLSEYEEAALREIAAWKTPRKTRAGKAGERLESAVDRASRRVPTKQVDKVLGWVLPRMRELTWRATSEKLVVRAYNRADARIASIEAVSNLDLQIADEVAGDRRAHEGAAAGIEGAAAGFFGGFTLAADVAAVMLLSMRAVQSRALAYGFDPSEDEELEYVLVVLDAASRLGPRSKTAARSGLSTLGKGLAGRAITQRTAEKAMSRLPAQLATRFAAMKSNSVLPVVGAITSASFNAWYLQAVTHTARMAYRERFLQRKYGDDLLAAYGC